MVFNERSDYMFKSKWQKKYEKVMGNVKWAVNYYQNLAEGLDAKIAENGGNAHEKRFSEIYHAQESTLRDVLELMKVVKEES
jgi:hypothetical protein